MACTKIEGFTLRRGGEEDIPLILQFIRQLAAYEHMLDQVAATEEILRESLFIKSAAEVIIGEYNGRPAGFALFFHNMSTFTGRPGIYLEDLFVKPEYREKGFGKAIIAYLARLAVERGCGRFEWSCLDWNEPSIRFYKSLGAVPLSEWTGYRLTGAPLRALAADFEEER